MLCGIYEIRNTATGDSYVGLSTNIVRRWIQHWKNLEAGRHSNRLLQAAWKLHGHKPFAFEILMLCELRELVECERKLIGERRATYNHTDLSHPTDKWKRKLFPDEIEHRKQAASRRKRIKEPTQVVVVYLPSRIVRKLDKVAEYEMRTRAGMGARIILEQLRHRSAARVR